MYGLWHLGTVTAACLAAQGFQVRAFDPDSQIAERLQSGWLPVAEPGLSELIAEGVRSGRLFFCADSAEALRDVQLLWVTFDTPVDEDDAANVGAVRAWLDAIRPQVPAAATVVISSQVPVGFMADLQRGWRADNPDLTFAYVPENLRLGQAITAFRESQRIVGMTPGADRKTLESVLDQLSGDVIWMTWEAAEVAKHAINGFLAVCIGFANELARLCEGAGADPREVERGLRADARVGASAPLTPGGPFAGGTLARDLHYLTDIAAASAMKAPIFSAVLESNRLHAQWIQERVSMLLGGKLQDAAVAILGLTYKVGTDTLRRSAGLQLAAWLQAQGATVRAFDPAVRAVPENPRIQLASTAAEALKGADVAVVSTPWPEFSGLTADQVVAGMRTPQLVDQLGFLTHLEADARVTYVRLGTPVGGVAGRPSDVPPGVQ